MELVPAVGVPNFGRVSEIRDPLDFVPEWRELLTLSEERAPAIEFGPSEFLGFQPCEPCGRELPNPSAAHGGYL
jgi:hypothetical protein